MKNLRQTAKSLVLAACLAVLPQAGAATETSSPSQDAQLAEKVRKEIVTLPFLSIFDHMTIRVENGAVTLNGQVVRPTLRSSAERVAQRVEGVASVKNQIEVLPLSPFDNQLRLRVARAVYGQSALNRYALGARPPIQIVVKNGNVTLEGVVLNEMDRSIAFLQANGVSGVFNVTNNLRVENPRKS